MQIRTVPAEDFSSVRHLLEQAFPDVSRSFFHAISQYDPWYNEKFSLAVEVGNKLVSFLQIFDRTMMIEGKPVRFGGIGSVGTHPNHTKKGYASALLNHAVQVMEQEEMAGGVLFTKIHPFYEKLGWQTLNLKEQIFQVNDLKFYTGNGFSSRPLRENDIEAVHDIYEKEQSKYSGTIRRNLPYWKKRPHWMSHPCRVLMQQDKVIGYYYTAKYRENVPMLHIIEYGFHNPDKEVINAFFEDVHKVAQENFCTSICANFHVHPQLNQFIQIQNIQSAQQPYSYMMWKNTGDQNIHKQINQLAQENAFIYWQTDAF